MHTRTAYAALLLTASALTAGCTSTGHDDAKPSTTPTTAEAAPATTAPATPATYAFGTPWAWQSSDGISGKTTTYSYKQPVHSAGSAVDEAGASGYVWAALDVEVCNDDSSTGPVDVSDTEWTLAYDDGSSVESSSSGYEDFPRPQFPMGGATVKAGRCLRGKIVFPVPGKGRPVRAVYAPAGLDEPIEWDVPAK
jgi:hypothetical protein